ncbi:Mu transposase domain-containing protein, partial [Paraburkholderia sp. EG304]|uniref:Mu transposase domain-containing protein n=1 Tax=Paraburkholderia sp. EG304 TaxID=3237015 RepID=UPI00397B60C2
CRAMRPAASFCHLWVPFAGPYDQLRPRPFHLPTLSEIPAPPLSSHRNLNEAIDQALMLRGHRDFVDRAAYDEFLREVVIRRNRCNAAAFRLEREQLMDLPLRRTTDFVEEEARVTRCSTFTVRGILYSAPSRLIGHRLKVRVYGDRLDCYLSGALVHITSRGSRGGDNRPALNYRHFIESLKRKLQSHRWISALAAG